MKTLIAFILGMAFVGAVKAGTPTLIPTKAVPATTTVSFYKDIPLASGDSLTITWPNGSQIVTVPNGLNGTVGVSVQGSFQ